MYNEEYYKGRKNKIGLKVQESKDKFLNRSVNETSNFIVEQRGLEADMQELIKEEAESKAEIKPEEIKPEIKPE